MKDSLQFLLINKKENGTEFILELIKQNQDFKELLIQQNKDHNTLINSLIDKIVIKNNKFIGYPLQF